MARARNNYSLPVRLDELLETKVRISPAHKGSLRHSIDFFCDEGTRVYAAMEGMVVYVKDNSDKGGPCKKYWNKGNRVVIKHQNGEYSAYEHFQYKGVNVKAGQRVRRGQMIGYSGLTGFTFGSHLHFEVFNNPCRDESEGETLQVFVNRMLKKAEQ